MHEIGARMYAADFHRIRNFWKLGWDAWALLIPNSKVQTAIGFRSCELYSLMPSVLRSGLNPRKAVVPTSPSDPHRPRFSPGHVDVVGIVISLGTTTTSILLPPPPSYRYWPSRPDIPTPTTRRRDLRKTLSRGEHDILLEKRDWRWG
jgi:hypothetical protein